MGGPRSTASREEILQPFHTAEGFKAVAKRLGMSPNTLRKHWHDAYGKDAVRARGKKIQARAAAAEMRSRKGKKVVFRDVTVLCTDCFSEITLKANQVAQLDVESFVCEPCRCDRECPVCDKPVLGAKGLSHHFRWRQKAEGDDGPHAKHQRLHADQQWEGLVEGQDYIRCVECGFRAASLVGHTKSAHGLSAVAYRKKHGGALIYAPAVRKRRQDGHDRRTDYGKGQRKQTTCPACSKPFKVSKFHGPVHEQRCPTCVEEANREAEDLRWAGKSEPEDYVTCLDCGYRGDSLNSHLMSQHPNYQDRHPDALVVALNSAVRDKTAIRGVPRPPEFGKKIAKAKLLNLTLEDFQPFLDGDGKVDRRAMMDKTGLCWLTVTKYAEQLGLPILDGNLAVYEDRVITLTAEDFDPFRFKNGKVRLSQAAAGLGFSYPTIKRECVRLGLPYSGKLGAQGVCLQAVSEALGGSRYKEEWTSWKFVNGATGHRFRFDGYFPEHGLVVEFHGYQHWTFPNVYMKDTPKGRAAFEKQLRHDRQKRELVEAAPDLTYLEIREDEPYDDPDWIRRQLVGLVGLQSA